MILWSEYLLCCRRGKLSETKPAESKAEFQMQLQDELGFEIDAYVFLRICLTACVFFFNITVNYISEENEKCITQS